MTRAKLPKRDTLAFLRQVYHDEVQPLERSVSRTDPKKREMHPVYLTFCEAYVESWRILQESVKEHPDGHVDFDKKAWLRIQELSPWTLFQRGASAESAHGTALGKYLLSAGLDYAAAYKEIERARKVGRGRPANREAAIMALEMELAGKTHKEIAGFLKRRHPSTGYDDSAHGVDRVRKLIGTVRPLYEKYRRRN